MHGPLLVNDVNWIPLPHFRHGFRVQGSGFKVQGSRFKVQGLSILDFGLRISDFKIIKKTSEKSIEEFRDSGIQD
jgi:hypothetical protein